MSNANVSKRQIVLEICLKCRPPITKQKLVFTAAAALC